MNWLNGSKTYIVAGVSIIAAWVGVWGGTVTFDVALQITETALLGSTIRHGIANS